MNYFSILTIALSHIVGALYIQERKYNKLLTTCLWSIYAICTACVMLFQENIVVGFFELFLMQAIIFFVTSIGSVSEKIFLFLTYANSFCIYIGANLILTAILGDNDYLQIYTTAILILIHMFLYKILIPSYRKSKIFFSSGWWKLNLVLVFFMIQFLSQYAFTSVDKNRIGFAIDFIIFTVIFYLVLLLLFDMVKKIALTNRKEFENAELKKIAYIDDLTNVQTRVAYMKYTKMQNLYHKKNMTSSSFIFVMTDIDDFKKINDIEGHLKGDEILICVGATINEHFEHFKCESFRIGGDEFVLLFEDKSITDVEEQMIEINKKLYNLKGIAMSYGCCEVDFNNERPFEEAYRKADALMYSNKEEKKMRI